MHVNMKRAKLLPFVFVLSLVGFFMTGCSKEAGELTIDVESITVDRELLEGITIKAGESTSIADRVGILPENATDKSKTFYSSNPDVVTVNAKGVLAAKAKGTSEIKISAGKETAVFTVTVTDAVLVPTASIEITVSSLDLVIGSHYNLLEKVNISPMSANDGLAFTSSDSQVVSVSEDGILEGVFEGSATVTVASKSNPLIKATLLVKVTVLSGDYQRTGWTMSASQDPLFKSSNDAEKNSLTSALDGDFSTNLCLVRPGKNFGSNPKVELPTGGEIYFVVDMQQPKEVNYFRILHRDKTQAFIRWFAFDKILGSNDGVTFSEIASDVKITGAGTLSQQESPNIAIPKSTYRYIKFYAKEATCFYQSLFTSQGSSTQIQELYLGLTP